MIKQNFIIAMSLSVAVLAVLIFSVYTGSIKFNINQLPFVWRAALWLSVFCFCPVSLILSYFLISAGSSFIIFLNREDILYSILLAFPFNICIFYVMKGWIFGNGWTDWERLMWVVIMFLCYVAVFVYNGILASKDNKGWWSITKAIICRVQISMMFSCSVPFILFVLFDGKSLNSLALDNLVEICIALTVFFIPPLIMLQKAMKLDGVKARQKVNL